MELTARNEADEGGVHLAGIVVPDEQPIFPADRLASELALAPVVVRGQAAVAEEALDRRPLVAGVADAFGNRRLVEDELRFLLAPREEGVDDGFGFSLPGLQLRLGRRLRDLSLNCEDASDQGEGMARPVRVRLESLVEIASGVRLMPSPGKHARA